MSFLLTLQIPCTRQLCPDVPLVVDSDYFFVEFLSGVLEKRGYQVRKAYDGKEGIAGLDDGPYDILFADLVMPKVNGRQFFEVVRRRFNGHCFPIVAVSGTVIEQMDDLDAIGADYFIAKGPMEKLAVRLDEFITGLERNPALPPAEKKILQTGSVFPRRDAMELLVSLEFYQTVINAIGVGVIVLDKDTRIINANPDGVEGPRQGHGGHPQPADHGHSAAQPLRRAGERAEGIRARGRRRPALLLRGHGRPHAARRDLAPAGSQHRLGLDRRARGRARLTPARPSGRNPLELPTRLC